MYCKNCGNQLPDGAAACTKCGLATGTGINFCANCGAQVAPGQAICTNCGAALAAPQPAFDPSQQKSKLIAGLLGIFLGGLGIHNFYLGDTTKGILHIVLSLACCIGSIWGLIDGIMILCGKVTTDAKGVPLKD